MRIVSKLSTIAFATFRVRLPSAFASIRALLVLFEWKLIPTPPSVDATFGGEDIDSAKSQTGYVFYFGGGLIDWSSHLQSVIALSSAESEQLAAYSTARTCVYFRNLLSELGHTQFGPTTIHEDNTACISFSKNPVNYKRNRQVLINHHYIRDLTENGIVRLEYLQTSDQIAYMFTKPLAPKDFQKFRPFLVSDVS